MSTSKKNLNKEIIALFSGQASMVTTPKLYIQLTGSHSLASVLNQCVFWSNKSECDDGYFHKTYKEWFKEINIPERTMRRYLDKLESIGWIDTKVKKIDNKNTKHVRTHMDMIIESISTMLSIECPIRPTCPNGENKGQNPCTKDVPTGQSGRSEPANLSDSSIYTEDNFQKKTTNCESSSSFFFSKELDEQMLNEKLCRDERSDEEFLKEVLEHVENHMKSEENILAVRQQGALKLLKKLKKQNSIFHVKGKQPKEIKSSRTKLPLGPFSEEDLELISEIKHALKMQDWGAPLEVHMPDPEKRKRAMELLEKSKALEAKPCQQNSPPSSARKNSLTSVSNLVSHLPLSQQDY